MRKRFRTSLTMLLIGVLCLLGVTSALAVTYNEAPMLRVKVAAGELPPVGERLPDEPLIVIPAEGEIGVYGGSMSITEWPTIVIADEYPISVELPGYLKPIPNIVKGWEINEDATEVTFFLRKGMKWSDGYPFTADDWMFWYNDIEGNTELTPIRNTWYEIGGQYGVLTQIDDYTIKWIFASTFGSFLDSLTTWPVRWTMQFAPAHYLKQFHPKYTSAEELNKKMEKEGFDTWMDLFGTRIDERNNTELPVVGAWVITNEWGSDVQIWERNPYFWKIDPEGNQLPYIDRVEYPRSAGIEATLLKLIAGKVDVAEISCVGGSANFAIMMENREKGNYRKVAKEGGEGAHAYGSLYFNVSHKNPAKRELFNNLNFRKALSVAINRREVVDVAHGGIGIITQVSHATGPPYHGEQPEFKEYYTQYDPKLANRLLDEIGLTKYDNAGYRLGLDGKKLLIILQVVSGWVMEMPDFADMYKDYFMAVGLNTIVKPMPWEALAKLISAVEYDIFVRYFAGGDILNSPANGYLFPRTADWHTAPLWARWILTDGEQGEEPPDWVKRLAAIDGEAKAEVNTEKRIALYTKAMLLHVNELMPIGCFGFGAAVTNCWVFGNRIRNVPDPIDMHAVSSQISSWYILEES